MADITNFRVKYELDTIDASNDIETLTSVGERAALSDLDNIYTKIYDEDKFVTKEHNHTVLDGSFSTEEFEGTGFFSNAKSNSQGEFATTPSLDFVFRNRHKSYALTICCVEDSPVKVRVEWYRGTLKVDAITSELDPNERINTIIQPVNGYDRVHIDFLKALPDRYIKINYIEFGTTMHWDQTIIKDGTLVKGLSRDGSVMSVNTLTFSIVDNSYDMNLMNPNGIHTLFQRDQAMVAYEDIKNEGDEDFTTLYLGDFFLTNYTAEGNMAKIVAVSYMGVLERFQFIASGIYNGIKASVVMGDIFAAAGISSSQYYISPLIGDKLLYGTIKPCNCKEALRQVLFATHATIDTSNPDHITISPYDTVVSNRIERKDKTSTKVTQIEAVDQVRLKYNTYTTGETETEIFTDDYPSGSTQTVYFDSPYSNIRIQSGADFVSSTAYSITFTVYSNSTSVTVMGVPYEVLEREIVKGVSNNLGTNNIVSFSTDLCSTATARTLLNNLSEYYGNTLQIEIQHYANETKMNTVTSVENQVPGLDNYTGFFEERTFNLTGGFLCSAKLRGYYDESDKNYYTGDDRIENSAYELFTGDDVPIL